MREEKKLDVYNEKVEELYKRLETNINGLSEIEAKKRLERDGENKLEERKKKSNLMLFLGQFNDFMIIILIIASIISPTTIFLTSIDFFIPSLIT